MFIQYIRQSVERQHVQYTCNQTSIWVMYRQTGSSHRVGHSAVTGETMLITGHHWSSISEDERGRGRLVCGSIGGCRAQEEGVEK